MCLRMLDVNRLCVFISAQYPPNPRPLSPVKRARGDIADHGISLSLRLRGGKGRVRGEILTELCHSLLLNFNFWSDINGFNQNPLYIKDLIAILVVIEFPKINVHLLDQLLAMKTRRIAPIIPVAPRRFEPA